METPLIISRRRVAVLAIACLGLSGILKVAAPQQIAAMSAFFRVGIVLAALWLALPSKGQPMVWRNFTPVLAIALAFALLASKPRLLLIVIPIGFVVLLVMSLLPPRRFRR